MKMDMMALTPSDIADANDAGGTEDLTAEAQTVVRHTVEDSHELRSSSRIRSLSRAVQTPKLSALMEFQIRGRTFMIDDIGSWRVWLISTPCHTVIHSMIVCCIVSRGPLLFHGVGAS